MFRTRFNREVCAHDAVRPSARIYLSRIPPHHSRFAFAAKLIVTEGLNGINKLVSIYATKA